MDPIKKGQEHLSRSAQMTLNLNLGLLENLSQKDPEFVESCLRDAISCVTHVKRDGNSLDRAASMTNQFDNTLRLMRKNGVEVTNSAMLSVFKKSLDEKAVSDLEYSLTPENKALVESAFDSEPESSARKKSFDNGGLSI